MFIHLENNRAIAANLCYLCRNRISDSNVDLLYFHPFVREKEHNVSDSWIYVDCEACSQDIWTRR